MLYFYGVIMDWGQLVLVVFCFVIEQVEEVFLYQFGNWFVAVVVNNMFVD